MNAKSLVENSGFAVLKISEERLYCRQSCVARAGFVAAVLFDVLEKSQNRRDIKILDLKQAGSLAQSAGGKCHQQLETLSIGIAGVDAGAAFARQVLTQECRQWGREHRHASSPRCRDSPAAAKCTINSGVACKYQ
ncbi:hypothetical protein WSK_2030 [Novosphingobium sp. Rr 2-17]|nr:hypothetical protein WSK_2030 [Novosphingobium sp. Rr 2-17]